MKTLYLLRHAKSSWENINSADFDRPLNARGLQAAPLVGAHIFERRFTVDSIVSSPAKRAKQTAILIKKSARVQGEIKYDERIYEASPSRLLEVVSEIEDDERAILLVGHNPGLEGFIKTLTGKIVAMPTAALAVIDLNVEKWSEIVSGCGVVRELIRPKSLD